MMKRIATVVLFGALAFTSVGLTGCKDYDDDISSLKTQVSDLSTTVTDKITTINSALTTLQSSDATLKTQVDAAQAAVTKLQSSLQTSLDSKADATTVTTIKSSLDAAIVRLADLETAKTQIEGSITTLQAQIDAKEQEQDKTIAQLLTADESMSTSITEAVARIAKAEQIITANSSDLATLTASLTSVQTDLNSKLNTIATNLQDLTKEVAANESSITAQQTALASYQTNTETELAALKNADSSMQAELKDEIATLSANLSTKITAVNDSLDKLKSTVASQRTELIGYTDDAVISAIKVLTGEYGTDVTSLSGANDALAKYVAAQKADVTDIKAKIEATTTALTTLSEQVTAITARLDVIENILTNMLTDIVLQGSDFKYYTTTVITPSGKKAGDPVTFGGENTDLKYGETSGACKGYIYATLNPNYVSFAGTVAELRNSQNGLEENITLGKAEAALSTDYLATITRTTKATTETVPGLYKFEVTVNDYKKMSSVEPPYPAYALTIGKSFTLNNKTYNSTITSKYDWNAAEYHKTFTPITKDGVTIIPTTTKSLSTNVIIQYTGNFYKYYITIDTDNHPDDAKLMTTTGLNTVYSHKLDLVNDTIPIEAIANDVNNKTVHFVFHGLNYDGTQVNGPAGIPFSITFAIPTYSANTWTESSYPKSSAVQSVVFSEISKANFITDATNWASKVSYAKHTSSVLSEVFSHTTTSVTPALTLAKGSTSNVSPASDLSKINTLVATYDPNDVEVGKTYSDEITFYDSNNYIVNTVTLNVTITDPALQTTLTDPINTKYRPVRIPAAFDNGTTTAWATSDRNGNAVYNLSNSFNMLLNNAPIGTMSNGTYLDIIDNRSETDRNTSPIIYSGNYSDGSKKVKVDEMYVQHASKAMTFTNQSVVAYMFGVSNFPYWGVDGDGKTFSIVFKSPIDYAGFALKAASAAKSTINYGNKEEIDNDGHKVVVPTYFTTDDFVSQDPSVSYSKNINYFGTSKDSRIVSVTYSWKAAIAGNEGLIRSVTADANGFEILTTTTASMTSNAVITIILKVTDDLGITSTKSFDVTIVKQN